MKTTTTCVCVKKYIICFNFADLSCLNMPFILGVVKCYVGGITVRMFADDATMENIQTTEEPESGGLPFGVHNLKIKITVSME